MLLFAVGESFTVRAAAAFTIAATLLAPLPVILVVQVVLVLPLLPFLMDQPAGRAVPAVPMELKFSVKTNGGAGLSVIVTTVDEEEAPSLSVATAVRS